MSETPVKWTAAGLTPEGNALQAALLGTGDGLTFTRAVAADAEGVERLDLTLQAPCTVDGPKCRVPVLLTNAGLETGFTMTELRFYVRRVTDGAPTGEEVLYATVTDETGDPIPTAAQSPGFTIDWAFVFQYGNASEVTVTLDPVGLVSIGMVGQPNGVAALGENGAVPIPQGGTGETTVQGAIDAFGMFLAISAAAAYDPEGSYAVGDYCTHGGKLHKCGTPIESGEAWNAEHWTETTVAKELAGRLSLSGGMMTGAIRWGDDKYLGIGAAPSQMDWTSGKVSIRLIPENAVGNDISKCAVIRNTGNGAEVPIATATPPQEGVIPLNTGVRSIGQNSYFQQQDGGTFFFIAAGAGSDGSQISNNQVIATFPISVRPNHQYFYPAVALSGASRYPGFVVVSTNGECAWVGQAIPYPGYIVSFGWFDTK